MADFDDEETEAPDAEENGRGVDDVEDADRVEDAEESEALEEDFKESLAEDDIDDIDDFDEDEVDEDLKVVDEALNQKDQNARTLAIRRALEERKESRRISEDLDYLDLDIDD